MGEIDKYVGGRIRSYRKMQKLTLQQLADSIHKSRATVSKYETGDISLDMQTLYEISEALDVSLGQLADYRPPREEEKFEAQVQRGGESPFFKADTLCFYFYDGRHHRLKEGVINIHRQTPAGEDGCREASMVVRATSKSGSSSEFHYTGSVLYSDMLIRFSFVNRYNKLEQDLLYIFNPMELRDYTEGLLCGISSADLMPCAFKCLVTLYPAENYEEIQQRLILTPQELRRWKKMNMFIVDNHSQI